MRDGGWRGPDPIVYQPRNIDNPLIGVKVALVVHAEEDIFSSLFIFRAQRLSRILIRMKNKRGLFLKSEFLHAAFVLKRFKVDLFHEPFVILAIYNTYAPFTVISQGRPRVVKIVRINRLLTSEGPTEPYGVLLKPLAAIQLGSPIPIELGQRVLVSILRERHQ